MGEGSIFKNIQTWLEKAQNWKDRRPVDKGGIWGKVNEREWS